MEGRYSAPVLNMRGRLPAMCAASFVLGASLEYIMCVTGFYHVYSVKRGEVASIKEREDEDFWIRVDAKRSARQLATRITDL